MCVCVCVCVCVSVCVYLCVTRGGGELLLAAFGKMSIVE